MSKTTKEDILIVALHLFARDGYEAVSVSQIAGELGMTKGALYRHYESKRDIFEHIVKRMEQGDGEQAESHDMPADKRKMNLNSMKRFLRTISWNTVNLCFRIGQKMILHRHFERCLR